VETLFVGCFAFGLIFTVASFALGAFGGGHDLHLPGFDAHHGGGGHADHGHVSPFNLSIIAAFVTWFGGAGWLLTRYSSLAAVAITLVASVAGLVGGGIVFAVLSRFIFPRLTVMREADYRVEGVAGRISSAIRGEGGTGEVVYSLAGARRVDGARSVTGEAIEQGAEVVIHRIERGIAWVQRWEQFARDNQLPAGEPAAPNNGDT